MRRVAPVHVVVCALRSCEENAVESSTGRGSVALAVLAKRDFNERFCDLLRYPCVPAATRLPPCEIRSFVVGDSFREFFIGNEYLE